MANTSIMTLWLYIIACIGMCSLFVVVEVTTTLEENTMAWGLRNQCWEKSPFRFLGRALNDVRSMSTGPTEEGMRRESIEVPMGEDVSHINEEVARRIRTNFVSVGDPIYWLQRTASGDCREVMSRKVNRGDEPHRRTLAYLDRELLCASVNEREKDEVICKLCTESASGKSTSAQQWVAQRCWCGRRSNEWEILVSMMVKYPYRGMVFSEEVLSSSTGTSGSARVQDFISIPKLGTLVDAAMCSPLIVIGRLRSTMQNQCSQGSDTGAFVELRTTFFKTMQNSWHEVTSGCKQYILIKRRVGVVPIPTLLRQAFCNLLEKLTLRAKICPGSGKSFSYLNELRFLDRVDSSYCIRLHSGCGSCHNCCVAEKDLRRRVGGERPEGRRRDRKSVV